MSDPTGMSIDEMETTNAGPPAVDLTKVKVDGEGVSELLKGKSVTEVLAQFGSMEAALKASEQARLTAELTAKTALSTQDRPVLEPVVEEPKEMSDEELAELHQTDPLKAMRVLADRSERRVTKNLESRLSFVTKGSSATAEHAARAAYPEEFELFKDDIQQIIKTIPNASAVMSNPQAWDDLMAVVRGKKGNFERMIEKRIAGNGGKTRETAQSEETTQMGFTEQTQVRRPAAKTVDQLDATQLEIADKLNLTPQEYIKWSKVG